MKKAFLILPLAIGAFAAVFTQTTLINATSSKEFPATLYSPKESALATRLTGYITHIKVEEGDRVKAGSILAVIDPSEAQGGQLQAHAAVQGANAGVLMAKSSYEDAKRDYERFKILHEKGVIPTRDLEKVELALTTKKEALSLATAHKEEAQAGQKIADNSTKYTTITSPVNGFVVRKLANVGELATAGRPLFVVSESGSLQAQVFIPESDLGILSIGQKGEIEIPSLGKKVAVTLKTIVPSSDPISRTFSAKFSLASTAGLMPGLYGKVRIGGGTTQNQSVAILPSALTKRNGITGVFIPQGTLAKFVRVSVVGVQGNMTLISGIGAGQKVIDYPKENLTDGKPY